MLQAVRCAAGTTPSRLTDRRVDRCGSAGQRAFPATANQLAFCMADSRRIATRRRRIALLVTLIASAVIAIAACKKPQRSNIPPVQQLPDAAVDAPG